MKSTLEVINQMQREGVIGKYAIGGAVGATLYLEPVATLDIGVFVALKMPPGAALLTLSPIYDYLTSRGHKIDKEHLMIEGWPGRFFRPPMRWKRKRSSRRSKSMWKGPAPG